MVAAVLTPCIQFTSTQPTISPDMDTTIPKGTMPLPSSQDLNFVSTPRYTGCIKVYHLSG